MTTAQTQTIPNVLSIAGSDPSGGAGIQADLKTFAALGCHGMAVITALTAQNTQGVGSIHKPPPSFVAEQIASIFADIDVAAVKIGMLGSMDVVAAVAEALAPYRNASGRSLPIVVDPVFIATSGSALSDDGVVEALWERLLPIATLVTPNLGEAARLAGVDALRTPAAIEGAARRLAAAIPVAWLIKGGDADTATADDLLFDNEPHWLSSPRIDTTNSHGTGCTLSSAIAAHLAKGLGLREAVTAAKDYLDAALAGADALTVGHGAGPIDHFVRWR